MKILASLFFLSLLVAVVLLYGLCALFGFATEDGAYFDLN